MSEYLDADGFRLLADRTESDGRPDVADALREDARLAEAQENGALSIDRSVGIVDVSAEEEGPIYLNANASATAAEQNAALKTASESELQERRDWFKQRGWDSSAEQITAELESRDPSETVEVEVAEVDSSSHEMVESEVEELQEKLEFYQSLGWSSNAERIRKELEEHGG